MFSLISCKFASNSVPTINKRLLQTGTLFDTSAATSTVGTLVPTFLSILCKKGIKKEATLAKVNSKLKRNLQVDNPIQIAVDAVKPILKYKRLKGVKKALPLVLNEKTQTNTAIKWIIESALDRRYNDKPCLEKGLYDEIMAIMQGTSSIYAKRFQYHRNPHQ